MFPLNTWKNHFGAVLQVVERWHRLHRGCAVSLEMLGPLLWLSLLEQGLGHRSLSTSAILCGKGCPAHLHSFPLCPSVLLFLGYFFFPNSQPERIQWKRLHQDKLIVWHQERLVKLHKSSS